MWGAAKRADQAQVAYPTQARDAPWPPAGAACWGWEGEDSGERIDCRCCLTTPHTLQAEARLGKPSVARRVVSAVRNPMAEACQLHAVVSRRLDGLFGIHLERRKEAVPGDS